MADLSNKNASILLLSSEPRVRAVLSDLLRDEGYVVMPASDLGRAVDALGMCNIDLLITHPYIDCMPGHQAAKYLRERNPRMAVLLVAGLLEDDRCTNRAEFEQFHIFPKPFKASEFVEEVRLVLTGRWKLRQSGDNASAPGSETPPPTNSSPENRTSQDPLQG